MTGASGFLGGEVLLEAARRGLSVVAVSRRRHLVPSGVALKVVESYIDTPAGDFIVHLAESHDANVRVASKDSSDMKPEDTIDILNRRALNGVCYASSTLVYGTSSPEVSSEESQTFGSSPYTSKKLENEKLVLDAGGTVFRVSNLLGAGMSAKTVVKEILIQLWNDGPIEVRDIYPIRDFLWVSDAARAVCDVIQSGQNGIFNVCSGQAVSIQQLIKRCLYLSGRADKSFVSLNKRASRVDCNRSSNEKIWKECGWQPNTTLNSGLLNLIEIDGFRRSDDEC